MSAITPLGTRQYQNPTLTNAETRPGNQGLQSGNSSFSPRAALDHVSLSKSGIDLSAQGLAERADAMGNATVDVAQNFIASFAQRLLGDSADGATLSFDSVSLETNSVYAALAQHSAGPGGTTDAAAFSLSESSHFIGKGTITTADGQSYAFEVEVQYRSRTEAAAIQHGGAADDGGDSAQAPLAPGATGQQAGAANSDDSSALPVTQLADIDFPGSLKDLLQLLGRQIQANLTSNAADDTQDQNTLQPGGNLTLRLINLVNSSALLDAATASGTAPASASAPAPATASATASATAPATATTTPEAAAATPAEQAQKLAEANAKANAKALANAYGGGAKTPGSVDPAA